jgi:hypothetical protein
MIIALQQGRRVLFAVLALSLAAFAVSSLSGSISPAYAENCSTAPKC